MGSSKKKKTKNKKKKSNKYKNKETRKMAENTTNSEKNVDATTEHSRSSSDEEGYPNKKCKHVKNSVNVKSVKKKVSDMKPSELECVTCAKSSGDTSPSPSPFTPTIDSVSTDDIQESSSSSKDVETLPKQVMQLCLSCGELHCGRNDKGHAIRHFEEKDHTISLNLNTYDAWCYKCDMFVVPSTQRNQIVADAQAIVRKHFSLKESDEENDGRELSYRKKGKNNSYQVTAPGLNNLGNTCFFNSVMQVVVGTSVLRSVLTQSDPYCDPHFDVSKCITATEEEVGPLTDAFKNFLREMWRTNDNVVSPRDLFSQISKKWQQFRGWRQQDSQELMRFLFDGVKSEELEHIKKLELQKPQKPQYMEMENDYDDPKEEEEDDDDEEDDENDVDDDSVRKQKDIKKYDAFIDACFGGKLVSVIVCNACKHCSYSYEEFLDVSLPIKSSSKNSYGYSEYGSYGSYGGSSSNFFSSTISSVFDNNDSSNNDDESGNKVEDENRNEDESSDTEEEGIPVPSKDEKSRIRLLLRDLPSDSGRSTPSKDVSLLDCLKSFVKVETLEGDNSFACDNCWKLKKAHNEQKKEEINDNDEAGDTGDTGDSVDLDNNKDDKNQTNGLDNSEIEADESSQDNMDVDDDNDTNNRRTETEPETGSSEVVDNENSSDTSDGVNKQDSNEFDNDNDGRINFLTTPKSKPEPEPELEPERPYIFRKAFKRYLFASLPPVMVFHLKRFQQVGGRWSVSMRKIDDFVSFDEELDVGDFVVPPEIDKNEKNGINNGHIIDGSTESSFKQNKQRKLSTKYRLYGVVVHLGSLYNGHYIAYVLSGNIRSEGEQFGIADFLHTDMNSRIRDFERQKHKTGDQRQWIYCSDSSVRAATVDEVLNSGAYLLFYERVDE